MTTPLQKSKSKEEIITDLPIKLDNTILRNKELTNFKKKLNESFGNLSPDTASVLSANDLLNKFEEHIVEKATEDAAREVRKRLNWFSKAWATAETTNNKAAKLKMRT